MDLEVEQLETELEGMRAKFLEIKELVDNLMYLWDSGSIYPDGERVINELHEIMEGLEN
jgi:virulence-associated protein VapD